MDSLEEEDNDFSSSGEGRQLHFHHSRPHSARKMMHKYADYDDEYDSEAQKARIRKRSRESVSKSELGELLDEKLVFHIKPLEDKIISLEKSNKNSEWEHKIKVLKDENQQLRERVNNMDTHSRRNNLRFYGITEADKENCEQILMSKLKDYFPHFNDRTFERVHRLGPSKKDITRPIIAKIFHFKDKLALLQKRKELNDNGVRISDDFCKEVETNRRPLLPIVKEGYKLGLRPKLVGDKLLVSGKSYTKDDLHKLPKNINPATNSTQTKHDITAFFTRYSPLSNFYPCSFQVGKDTYNCGEQYLTVAKARKFGDGETVKKLFREKEPLEQKKLGNTVNNYVHSEWLQDSEKLLYKGIYEKFSQSKFLKNYLLSTGDSLLVEASKDKVWGVGLQLHDEAIWDKDNHTGGNKLGRILMNVREKLKKTH